MIHAGKDNIPPTHTAGCCCSQGLGLFFLRPVFLLPAFQAPGSIKSRRSPSLLQARECRNNLLNIYKGKAKLLVSELKDSDAAGLGASALAWELKDLRD